MKRLFAVTAASLFWLGAVAAQTTSPDELVEKVTQRIIELIQENRAAYAADHSKLYAMVDKEVLPYFDFRVMSRAVLGRYWRQASEAQRNRFVEEFRELLVRTYATALLKYNDEEIRMLPFRASPEDKQVLVRTEIVQPSGPNIPMNFSFYRSASGWKVYDIAIEGVSLVTSYRSTYAQRIQSQGLEGLIESLAEANRRGRAGGTQGGGR